MEATSENRQDNADLTRREFLAACAQTAIVGAAVFAVADSPATAGTGTGDSIPNDKVVAATSTEAVEISEEEYVRYQLERTRIERILMHREPTMYLLRDLRIAGIKNVGQLANCSSVPGISASGWKLLCQWHEGLTQEYKRQYREWVYRGTKPYAGWWRGYRSEMLNAT